jgi:periplasmic copper chaperone A
VKRIAALALLLWSTSAFSQVSIEGAWARATPPNAKLAAGYLTVVNAGAADRLLGASSPAAERVEMHVTLKDGDILRMRQVKDFEVPANGRLELKPAGGHLMFVGIKWPFRDGEKVPVTLRFERAGELKVELAIGQAAERGGHHRH